ncbi:acyl-CoA dehydrogenase family protein [Blastococcus sp. URHD0036]|uniref:acyl-CoA dehydrogenase family protein n=1 Tax=Blastococcus sp. URHD0036 TaxID=1380356 RepID=UPI00049582D1|nr:acyl-CoA dehydrogenase family protein [Blastococcus sp. URHD0036]
MHFDLSTEQRDLQASVRAFLAKESPTEAARELPETEQGYDPALWSRMADDLGLHALAVPEEHGGIGASFVELVVVLEEMGRQLVPSPFFSSAVLATRALLRSGDVDAMSRLLPGLAEGTTIGTLALTEDDGSWDLDAVRLAAEPDGNGWALTGAKAFVPDGQSAGLVLVVARSAAGLCLFAVDGDAPGLSRSALPVLDGTRRLARLEFDRTPAVLVGADGAAGPGLRRALEDAAVALGAEQIGAAQRCLDMAVGYAGTRVAFGRPIGSFQAIKHKCADMVLDIESGRSAVWQAAWSVSVDGNDVPLAAAAVQAHCSEAYVRAAQQNIQIHGGIGFTWEHDAHLYLKRALSSRELLGAPDQHLLRIADQMGL